jgi:hypothetical protein
MEEGEQRGCRRAEGTLTSAGAIGLQLHAGATGTCRAGAHTPHRAGTMVHPGHPPSRPQAPQWLPLTPLVLR